MPTPQILRTVKDFAERFTFLPAFESNVPFLSAMSRILSIRTRKSRNDVHFPNHTHIVFNDACVGLLQ